MSVSLGRIALPAAGGLVAGLAVSGGLDAVGVNKTNATAIGGVLGAIGVAAGLVMGGTTGATIASLGAGLIGGAVLHQVIAGNDAIEPRPIEWDPPVEPAPPGPWDPKIGDDIGTGPGKPFYGPLSHVEFVSSTLNTGLPTPDPMNVYEPQAGDMLPDGIQIRPDQVFIETIRKGQHFQVVDENGWPQMMTATKDRQTIRFDSQVGNAGPGALQLAMNNLAGGKTATNQVIFTRDGGARQIDMDGRFINDQHPEHNHLHFDDFEVYGLYRQNPDGTLGEQVGSNRKASFYITNIRTAPELGSPTREGAADFTRVRADVQQGISQGWADVYGAGLDGQEIDITGLNPGTYVLRQSFDPSNRIAEVNETNNVRDTIIRLS